MIQNKLGLVATMLLSTVLVSIVGCTNDKKDNPPAAAGPAEPDSEKSLSKIDQEQDLKMSLELPVGKDGSMVLFTGEMVPGNMTDAHLILYSEQKTGAAVQVLFTGDGEDHDFVQGGLALYMAAQEERESGEGIVYSFTASQSTLADVSLGWNSGDLKVPMADAIKVDQKLRGKEIVTADDVAAAIEEVNK